MPSSHDDHLLASLLASLSIRSIHRRRHARHMCFFWVITISSQKYYFQDRRFLEYSSRPARQNASNRAGRAFLTIHLTSLSQFSHFPAQVVPTSRQQVGIFRIFADRPEPLTNLSGVSSGILFARHFCHRHFLSPHFCHAENSVIAHVGWECEQDVRFVSPTIQTIAIASRYV